MRQFEQTLLNRREFLGSAAALFGVAGCSTFLDSANGDYAVAILGDTHFDAEPESVYHSHYDESNRWAKVQHAEFKRNGEMWRQRCKDLLAASGKLAHAQGTDFVLQMGDLIQGDCDDVPTHQKMLADCIALFSKAYPADLPFLTVMGNHDFRGKGARRAYLDFAEPFMSRAAKCTAKYPVFSFLHGEDLWVFCDFGTTNIAAIRACIEASPDVRYTFLVTHGPFTCSAGGGSYRWRLAGSHACDAERQRLYKLLSRRHAIVLSGHTHTTAYYRYKNKFGGFAEFTSNSVWTAPERATAVPLADSVAQYGRVPEKLKDPKARSDYAADMAFFLADLTDYFFNLGAGHYRLNVASSGVTMDFYPGAATVPARAFALGT